MNKAAYLDEKYYQNPYSILPPNNPYKTDDVEKYTQNVDKAKELLKRIFKCKKYLFIVK